MGYAIELSFDTRKIKNLHEEQKTIYDKALEFDCVSQYHMHEMEGYGRKTTRSDYIHVVIFDSESFENLLEYIKHIKKERRLCIECIYKDDTNCDLLYASSKFIKRMDKQTSLHYRREKKKEIIKSEEQKYILKALKIENHQEGF
jgi:D-lyxose ketol-isomerase